MKAHQKDINMELIYRDRFLHANWIEIVQLVYAYLGPRFVGWMKPYNNKEMHVRISRTAVKTSELPFRLTSVE